MDRIEHDTVPPCPDPLCQLPSDVRSVRQPLAVAGSASVQDVFRSGPVVEHARAYSEVQYKE